MDGNTGNAEADEVIDRMLGCTIVAFMIGLVCGAAFALALVLL